MHEPIGDCLAGMEMMVRRDEARVNPLAQVFSPISASPSADFFLMVFGSLSTNLQLKFENSKWQIRYSDPENIPE